MAPAKTDTTGKRRTWVSLLHDQSVPRAALSGASLSRVQGKKMKRPHEHLADHGQDDARANHRHDARQRTAKYRAPIDPAESPFDLLPDELAVHVLAATGDVGSVVNWSRTSRRHRALANDPLLWRRLYRARFGAPLHGDFARRGKDWQWLYRARACDGRAAAASVGEISTTMPRSDTPALYWGDLVDGVPHGYGLVVAAVSAASVAATTNYYEGAFYHGEYDGYGRCAWPDGNCYEGNFMGNETHGRGTYTWPDGARYEGDFVKGKRHGWGTYTWSNGTRYEGRYADGKKHGHGICTWPDGERYEGTYVNGTRHGRGISAWPDGRCEIGYRNGKMHGRTVYLYPDGSCARGHYADGNITGNTAVTHGDRCAPTRPCMTCAADPFGERSRS